MESFNLKRLSPIIHHHHVTPLEILQVGVQIPEENGTIKTHTRQQLVVWRKSESLYVRWVSPECDNVLACLNFPYMDRDLLKTVVPKQLQMQGTDHKPKMSTHASPDTSSAAIATCRFHNVRDPTTEFPWDLPHRMPHTNHTENRQIWMHAERVTW